MFATKNTAATIALGLVTACFSIAASATITESTPYQGITHTEWVGESVYGRKVNLQIVQIDLTAPGIGFKMTPAGGTLDTVRQSTLGYLNQEHAQLAVNAGFFLPFPSASTDANLIGFAASNGNVYSPFEAPVQSYALVTNSPAINLAPDNSASIVHNDTTVAGGKAIVENVAIGNAFSGSAQIVTNGVLTIPYYKDATHPDGLLTTNATYSNSNSWYNLFNARNAIGLSQDQSELVIFTVDKAGGSVGLSVGQVAQFLVDNFGVYNALNMDGGGSTTLAMRDPFSGIGGIVNTPSDATPGGRLEGSNLAIFAAAVPEPETYALLLGGLGLVGFMARRRIVTGA